MLISVILSSLLPAAQHSAIPEGFVAAIDQYVVDIASQPVRDVSNQSTS